MNNYFDDNRVVMTLDAGGTNFVFNAVKGCEEIIKPVVKSAKQDSLDSMLKMIIEGFDEVKELVDDKVYAISFAFPGPADYKAGVILNLDNLEFFTEEGVALGPMLEDYFGVPVYINNDGDLFALGESIAGFLPYINKKLKNREYKNLLGITLGTGFGGGVVSENHIIQGDNSAQGEINRFRNKYGNFSAEKDVNIQGVIHNYSEFGGSEKEVNPKDICDIALGYRKGNKDAAIKAFNRLGEVAGDACANAVSLTDGLVVIGGGISGAYKLFLKSLVDEMNSPFDTLKDRPLERMEVRAYNLEDEDDLKEFLRDESKTIKVPFSDREIRFEPVKKVGVGVSRLGTSRAVSIGAYCFALLKEDDK